jgi:hypothetical protein
MNFSSRLGREGQEDGPQAEVFLITALAESRELTAES